MFDLVWNELVQAQFWSIFVGHFNKSGRVEDDPDEDHGHGQGAEGPAKGQDDSVDFLSANFRNFGTNSSANLK